MDHIFPNEPNQKLLINILEGIPCDRSEVKLFEYHNQIFQKLKFLNRFTFDSCNQRLIMNSYHMNDKPEANQNQFKIQEDKFFFSFLNQVITNIFVFYYIDLIKENNNNLNICLLGNLS